MFAKPRIKKSPLPPPSRKRKSTSDIEEISFDQDARKEFLTGFHKRKQQRKKNAQEVAAKKARQEQIDTRRQLRQDRKREIEEHVERVNQMLKESSAANPDIEPQDGSPEDESEEWGGFPDRPELDIVDHEEEYIDEDRYTTVTVESVDVNRHGFSKPELDADGDIGEGEVETAETGNLPEADDKARPGKASKRPPKKRKQFRYESKLERSIENVKQKARHKAKRK